MGKGWRRVVAGLIVGAAVVAAWNCHRPRPTDSGVSERPTPRPLSPLRAIWVTRWDYKTPDDIRAVLDNCRAAGFNTVLWQVRGAGTVMYPSSLEPWAPELGGRDPGFDPLAVACQEARRRNLKLHAWVNVMPAWFGKKPPDDPHQLYHAKPDWFLRDAQGRRQPMGWYSSLNPCHPEVRHYLVTLMHELVTRYPIAGLHLDYIRFPLDWHEGFNALGGVPDYPRDPRTLALFARQTGLTPDRAPEAWRNWRAEQVNALVRDLRRMTTRTRPDVVLSAAAAADADRAFNAYFQDARLWLERGWIDAVFPMNYAKDVAEYQRRLDLWMASSRGRPVVTGIMFDRRSPDLVGRQLDLALQRGPHFAAFAYNSLFERRDSLGRPKIDDQSPSRAQLRQTLLPYLQTLARQADRRRNPPDAPG